MKVAALLAVVSAFAVTGGSLMYIGLSSSANFLFVKRFFPGPHPVQQFTAATWLPRSEVQVGLGLCVIAALSLPLAVKWKLPPFLTAERKVTKKTKAVALALVIVGLIGFTFFAGYIALWNLIPPPHALYRLFNYPSFPGGNWFGVPSAVSFASASLAALVFWIEGGLLRALKRVLTLVMSPPVFIYALGLLLFYPSNMVWHVTNFLSLGVLPRSAGPELGFFPISVSPSFDSGIDLFSNWLVLMLAGFLTSVGLWDIIPKNRGITTLAGEPHHFLGMRGHNRCWSSKGAEFVAPASLSMALPG